MARAKTQFVRSLALWIFLLAACILAAIAETPLTVIDMPQGGKIVYGKVADANTQAEAIASILRSLHKNCGEKPQVGKMFAIRGTGAAGLFFTVINRAAANEQLAGLILAAGSGVTPGDSQHIEAAVVSDKADRFGQSVNPMLTRLFGVWHPAGLDPVVPLKTVKLDDGSASVGLPEGWKLELGFKDGAILVSGPNGERIGIDFLFMARDPTNPSVRRLIANSSHATGGQTYIDRPYDSDLGNAFPEILQQIRKSFGLGPARLSITRTEKMPAPAGGRCIHVTGTVDPDGKGDCAMETFLCTSAPSQSGLYILQMAESVLPNAVAEQERATAQAIFASFQTNMPLINAQRAEETRRFIDDPVERPGGDVAARFSQAIRIHEMEDDARARMSSSWFNNFLLDQTVVADVKYAGKQGEEWTRAADFWQKAYPYRIADAPESHSIKAQDF